MSSLDIPVSTVPDAGLHVDVSVAAEVLKPVDVAPLPLSAVVVRGTLTPLVGQYLFQGTLEAVFTHPCDRCLAEAEFPVSLPVVWTFEEDIPDAAETVDEEADDEEAHGLFGYDGTVIDLARPVWDEVALAFPVKFLCREDCRGLCPVCGGNRNTQSCSCEVESPEETPAGHRGFAGLKDMFPDLPEQR